MTTLVRNGFVLPMGSGLPRAFDPGSVLLDGDTIVALGSVAEIDADPRASGAGAARPVARLGLRRRPRFCRASGRSRRR